MLPHRGGRAFFYEEIMIKNEKIDCIFFDCFGVLVSEIAPQWLGANFPEEEALKINADIIRKADLGIISEDETYTALAQICGKTAQQVKSEWKDIPTLNEEMVNTVIELRKSYKTILLSNAITGLAEYVLGDELIKKMFDDLIISSRIGMAKPDDNIFEYAISLCGCPAGRTVFTDDNPKNIAAAEKHGINGIVFRDTNSFLSALGAL